MIRASRYVAVLFFSLVAAITVAAPVQTLPSAGVIPDETTAVKVGEAILTSVFGAEEVHSFSPYHAELQGSTWTVYGTLRSGSRGGTPMIRLRKKDAKVLEIWHSQ